MVVTGSERVSTGRKVHGGLVQHCNKDLAEMRSLEMGSHALDLGLQRLGMHFTGTYSVGWQDELPATLSRPCWRYG